jgi:hypothetical protein
MVFRVDHAESIGERELLVDDAAGLDRRRGLLSGRRRGENHEEQE